MEKESKKRNQRNEGMKMEEFEKVEKLVDRAGVTYEEAKEALEKNNGDILDAMVYLEKNGKTKKPDQSSYKTNNQEQPGYENVTAKVEESRQQGEKEEKSVFSKIWDGIKYLLKKGSENFVQVKRKEETIIKIPILLFVILMLCFWEVLLILIIASLFLDCRYTLVGSDEDGVEPINRAMDQAADFADTIKSEVDKKNG